VLVPGNHGLPQPREGGQDLAGKAVEEIAFRPVLLAAEEDGALEVHMLPPQRQDSDSLGSGEEKQRMAAIT
jgi:hypothetical protein